MTADPATYPGYRFPAEVIRHAVWLHHVFGLSLRDVELILAERGIGVAHESVRRWCLRFGADFARRLRRRRPRPGDTWHLDEVWIPSADSAARRPGRATSEDKGTRVGTTLRRPGPVAWPRRCLPVSRMSLRPMPIGEIPTETARVAAAAFPKGTLVTRLRDEFPGLLEDADFRPLYSSRGRPGLAPWRPALVTVLQFLERLSDRQAADAVRARRLALLGLYQRGFGPCPRDSGPT